MRKGSFSVVVALVATLSPLAPVMVDAAQTRRAVVDPYRAMIIPGRGFGPPGTIATATAGAGTIFLRRTGLTVIDRGTRSSMRFVGAGQPEVVYGPENGGEFAAYLGCGSEISVRPTALVRSVRLAGLYRGIDLVLFATSYGKITSVLEATSRADLSVVKIRSASPASVDEQDLVLGSKEAPLRIGPPSLVGAKDDPLGWSLSEAGARIADAGTTVARGAKIRLPLIWLHIGVGLHGMHWRRLEQASTGFVGAGTYVPEYGSLLEDIVGHSELAGVVRFDAHDQPISWTLVGGKASLDVSALSVDAQDRALIGGRALTSCMPEEAAGLPVAAGQGGAYAFGLDADGVLAWADVFGDGASTVRSIATSSDGVVALVGDGAGPEFKTREPVFPRREWISAFFVRRSPAGNVTDASLMPGIEALRGVHAVADRFTLVGSYSDARAVARGRVVEGTPNAASSVPFSSIGQQLLTHHIGSDDGFVARTRFLQSETPGDLSEVGFEADGSFIAATRPELMLQNHVQAFPADGLERRWSHETGPLHFSVSNVVPAPHGGAYLWIAPTLTSTTQVVPVFWGLREVDATGAPIMERHGSTVPLWWPWAVGLGADDQGAVVVGSKERFGAELYRY